MNSKSSERHRTGAEAIYDEAIGDSQVPSTDRRRRTANLIDSSNVLLWECSKKISSFVQGFRSFHRLLFMFS